MILKQQIYSPRKGVGLIFTFENLDRPLNLQRCIQCLMCVNGATLRIPAQQNRFGHRMPFDRLYSRCYLYCSASLRSSFVIRPRFKYFNDIYIPSLFRQEEQLTQLDVLFISVLWAVPMYNNNLPYSVHYQGDYQHTTINIKRKFCSVERNVAQRQL